MKLSNFLLISLYITLSFAELEIDKKKSQLLDVVDYLELYIGTLKVAHFDLQPFPYIDHVSLSNTFLFLISFLTISNYFSSLKISRCQAPYVTLKTLLNLFEIVNKQKNSYLKYG